MNRLDDHKERSPATFKACVTIALVSLSAILFCASTNAAELSLNIEEPEASTGSLFISVYDNKKDWMKENTVARQNIEVAEAVSDGKITVNFDLPPGEYAVLMYHDVNDNGKLDTRKPIPIPKEPVGLSNNKPSKFGPPKYKRARFDLTEDGKVLDIVLQ